MRQRSVAHQRALQALDLSDARPEGHEPLRHPVPRRSWAAASALVALVLLLLAGCTDGEEAERGGRRTSPTAEPAEDDASRPASPPHAEPRPAWSEVSIGGGGFVTGLVVGPDDQLFVRTDVGGAYRRDGDRWVQMLHADAVPEPRPSSDYAVAGLAVSPQDPDVVYLAVGASSSGAEGRVLGSRDGGRTWDDSSRRWPIRHSCRQVGERVAVDPQDPAVVWLSGGDGLWRSTDHGATWRQVPGPRPSDGGEDPLAGCVVVLLDPGADGAVVRLATDLGLYRSSDGGATWSEALPLGGGIQDVERAPDGDLLVVSTSAVTRVRPSDGSTTVITPPRDPDGADLRAIAVDPTDPQRLLVTEAGMRDGHLYRSNDGGRTWTTLDIAISTPPSGPVWPTMTTLERWMSVGALGFDSTGQLWFAEGMGVWRTRDLSDGEVTWVFDSTGIEELVSNDIHKVPGGPLLTAHWDRGLFIHDGGRPPVPHLPQFGSAWSIAGTPADPDVVAVVVNNHQRSEQGDEDQQSAISTDGGRTWTRMRSLTDGVHPPELKFGNIAISSSDPSLLVWMPSEGGRLHRSTDQGATWEPATEGPWSDKYHPLHHLHRSVLTADPDDGQTFYLMSQVREDGGLFVTTDGGRTWAHRASTGLPDYNKQWNATLRAVGDGALFFALGPFGDQRYPLYRSTDSGRTWEALDGTDGAEKFGIGAEVDGVPTLWLYRVEESGDRVIERSTDLGRSFEAVATHPLGRYDGVAVVEGDPDDPDTVYVGYRGTGVVRRASPGR